MLKRLRRRCANDHEHQHLVAGRASAAAFYPAGLVQQILRGIRDTADAEERLAKDVDGPHEQLDQHLIHAITTAEHLHDIDPNLKTQLQAQDIRKRLDKLKIPVKHADGSVENVPQWRASCNDE